MYKKILALFVLPVFLVILSSCSDSPTSISPEGVLRSDFIGVNEINSLNDSLNQNSSYFKKVVSLGLSNRLLLGNSNNFTASTLINFEMLMSDTSNYSKIRHDSLVIINATVVLTKTYEFGDTNQTINFTAHEVTSKWQPLSFKAGDNLTYNTADISTNKEVNDSLTTFTLDNSLVLSWFKDAVNGADTTDNGIYLKPVSSGVIMGYQSLPLSVLIDTVDIPRIWVVYQFAGQELDTLTLYPEGDLSIVEGDIPAQNQENIYVQSGLTVNSKVWFDLSGIPAHSTINSAILTFTVDTLNTLTGTSYTNSLVASRIFNANNTDSLTNSIALSRSGNTFKGEVRTMIQTIFNSGFNNGILVSPSNQVDGVELFALKGSTATDPALRPHLKIIYTSNR